MQEFGNIIIIKIENYLNLILVTRSHKFTVSQMGSFSDCFPLDVYCPLRHGL